MAAPTFAEAVNGNMVEARRELLGEVQHWLREYERDRRLEDRGRLLQALDDLALLVRVEWGD